jgi:hypothetical protein
MNLPRRTQKPADPQTPTGGSTDVTDDAPAAHGSHRLNAATIDESGHSPQLEAADIDEEALLAEFEAEKPARVLTGIPGAVVFVGSIGLSLYALYWVFNPTPRKV